MPFSPLYRDSFEIKNKQKKQESDKLVEKNLERKKKERERARERRKKKKEKRSLTASHSSMKGKRP